MKKELKKCIDGLTEIKATNKSPLYNNMLYWSQKPYNICAYLIKNLSKDGDIVFDPFMGSGVTVIESLNKTLARKSIGIDINDMPIFLCKSSLLDISKKEIDAISNFKYSIDFLNDEYETIVNKKRYAIKKTYFDLKPKFVITKIEYDSDGKSTDKNVDDEDYIKFNKKHIIKHIDNTDLLEDSRIAVKKGEKLSDKFTSRNFYVLDRIRGEIDKISDGKIRTALLFIYASIIHKSKILDYKMGSQWALWIPKQKCLERNVVVLMQEAIDKYIHSIDFIKDNYYLDSFVNKYNELKNHRALIYKKPIQKIDSKLIPENSVDLVITDPPYLSQVPYSEYMQLYKGFLGNDINLVDEIVMSNAQGLNKNYDNYIIDLETAFINISSKMKENTYLCMYFHDSSLKFWTDLIEIMNNAFLKFEVAVHIDKNQKTLKKILDPKKTMSGESLLFFIKSSNKNIKDKEFSKEHYDNLNKLINKYFNENKNTVTSAIFDNVLINYLIENRLLKDVSKKYKDFIELLQEFLIWDDNQGVWKIK